MLCIASWFYLDSQKNKLAEKRYEMLDYRCTQLQNEIDYVRSLSEAVPSIPITPEPDPAF